MKAWQLRSTSWEERKVGGTERCWCVDEDEMLMRRCRDSPRFFRGTEGGSAPQDPDTPNRYQKGFGEIKGACRGLQNWPVRLDVERVFTYAVVF